MTILMVIYASTSARAAGRTEKTYKESKKVLDKFKKL